jgi:hypothetical protein
LIGFTSISNLVFSDEGVDIGEAKYEDDGEEALLLREGVAGGEAGLTPAAIWYQVKIFEVMLE